MSDEIDALLARLAAEGELDSEGGFSLDPAVALAKLREHQLRDPSRFVLSWVRAAVMRAAAKIEIELDADDVILRFDGEPFSAAELDDLWAMAAGERCSLRRASCHELALGINGAFAWDAKTVSVVSGAARVEFDREFAMTRASLAEPRASTTLHAKRPLGWALLRRRLLDASARLPEELLLANACAYAEVEIAVEGRRLDLDPLAQQRPWIRLALADDEGRRGALILREGARSQVHVLKAGVEVCTVELDYGAGWVEAVIDDPFLPLDLSQEKPVEGPRWAALLDAVARARWDAWARRRELDGRWLEAMLQDIFTSDDLRWTAVPGLLELAGEIPLERAVDDPLGGLRSLSNEPERPILHPFPAAEPLTLAELAAAATRDGQVFTHAARRPDLPYVLGLPVLLRSHGATAAWLRPLAQAEDDYWRMLGELRRMPSTSSLAAARPDVEFVVDEPEPSGAGSGPDLLGVRAIWLGGDWQGVLILGRRGRRLAEFRLPRAWGPLWIEVEGPFEFEGEPAPDAQVALALLAGLSRHHDLLAALAREAGDEAEREHIRAYLRDACGRWSARRLAELTRLPTQAWAEAVARWPGPWGVPPAWTAPGDPTQRGRLLEHAIAELPWLAHGGREWTTRELAARIERGPLVWIDREDPRAAELPAEVWRLDAAERRQLASLFPGALQRFDLHAWARREPGSHALPDALAGARLQLSLRGDAGERGLLGLPARDDAGPAHAAVLRVLVAGHELAPVEVPVPLGPLIGAVELVDARVLAHSDRLAKDEAWPRLVALVDATALALARAQLEAWRAGAFASHERARVRAWLLALERGGWPEFAVELRRWQALLPPNHPLRVDLPPRQGALA